jgi:hypothetical protein
MFGHIIKDFTNFLSGGALGALKPPPEAQKPEPINPPPKAPPSTNPRERAYPITVMPVPITVKEVDVAAQAPTPTPSISNPISQLPRKRRTTGLEIGRVSGIRNQSHILEKIKMQRELCDDDEGMCFYR